MRKVLLTAISGWLLAACSTPQQVRTAPLDLNTVNDYNAKVNSGNTVPANQRHQQQKPVDIPLNASDSHPRIIERTARPRVILAPGVGYYRGYYHPWYY